MEATRAWEFWLIITRHGHPLLELSSSNKDRAWRNLRAHIPGCDKSVACLESEGFRAVKVVATPKVGAGRVPS